MRNPITLGVIRRLIPRRRRRSLRVSFSGTRAEAEGGGCGTRVDDRDSGTEPGAPTKNSSLRGPVSAKVEGPAPNPRCEPTTRVSSARTDRGGEAEGVSGAADDTTGTVPVARQGRDRGDLGAPGVAFGRHVHDDHGDVVGASVFVGHPHEGPGRIGGIGLPFEDGHHLVGPDLVGEAVGAQEHPGLPRASELPHVHLDVG